MIGGRFADDLIAELALFEPDRRAAFQREIGTVVARVVRIGEYEKAAITGTIHG